MSGILDSKTRIIDVIMTLEGRRQLARGDMRVEHVSFTDAGTYYRGDVSSGSADATNRIFLETSHLPQDSITFEANDAGLLNSFKNAQQIQVKDGQIISFSFTSSTSSFITGALENTSILKGTQFASTAETLLAESLENFKKLQIIGTKDKIFEDDGFALGNPEIEFTITADRPIQDKTQYMSHIDASDSLFQDIRLSNVKNFKFLPPVNRINNVNIDKSDHSETSLYQLGNYKPWGRTNVIPLDYKQIKHELKYYEDLGYCKTVNFDPTSRENRLVGQMFEFTNSRLKKLDVIDYGIIRTDDQINPLAHVFFIGKIVTDDNDSNTFVHLFTLLFE